MVDRAVLLADKQFHRENLRLVEETLFDNFYPQKFIRENINIRLNNLAGKEQLASNQIAQNNEMRSFISIPYVEGLSERIAKILRDFDITAAFKNKRDLTTVLRPTKDKLNKSKQCNIVYGIWCKDRNCRAVYIGQTKRPLKIKNIQIFFFGSIKKLKTTSYQ